LDYLQYSEVAQQNRSIINANKQFQLSLTKQGELAKELELRHQEELSELERKHRFVQERIREHEQKEKEMEREMDRLRLQLRDERV